MVKNSVNAAVVMNGFLNGIPETGFLRLPQVLQLFPVSRSAWWAGIAAGRYPAGVKLSPRTTAWKAEDIRALIERTGALNAEEA